MIKPWEKIGSEAKGDFRIFTIRSDRKISGVCGGLAEYFQIDPTLVRIGTVVLAIFTGGAVAVGYILAIFLVPEEGTGA